MKRAVVLFEGAGGATQGLHDAGYTTVGFDHWQPAVTCAQANGFDARLHDLADPAQDHHIPYAPLWWASPPCQPFSAAGDGEGEFDGRDGFPWLLRLTALRLPDVLLIENVKGLTFAKHSAYFCAVLEGFRALGYDVDWRMLNCADLGVPQTRERCIIVCRRDGGPITWPMPTHTETVGIFTAPWRTMADALGPVMATHLRPFWSEHRGHPDRLLTSPAPAVTINAGDWHWVVRTNQTTTGGDGYYQRSLDRPAPSLTSRGDLWEVGEPGPRDNIATASRLTTPELTALQGFPADWTWTGTKTQQAKMIGNACPPRLAAAVATVNRPDAREVAA